MQSNICIGPSFNGSIAVKAVKEMRGKIPVYDRVRIFPTLPEQDYDMVCISGKAAQSSNGTKIEEIGKLFNYINGLKLTTANKKELLNLEPPKGHDIGVSIAGTHVVVRKNSQQVGDVNLELFSEILT